MLCVGSALQGKPVGLSDTVDDEFAKLGERESRSELPHFPSPYHSNLPLFFLLSHSRVIHKSSSSSEAGDLGGV